MNTLIAQQSTPSGSNQSQVELDEHTLAFDADSHLVLPHWSRLLPAVLLFSNWGLLLWLGSYLESLVAQLILLPLSMLGVALAWGWHRD